ncbi:MAG: NAD(P)-dependent oxidoreductase [Clostridiales bacterium]|nr:NAD(P)-dependent oxidoreductase [Clostridiales bacterium]
MKVLVTGAGGYIGRHVVKKLLDMGNEVVACSRSSDKTDAGAINVKADILTAEKRDWFSFFGRPDACVHLAWRDGFVHNSPSHMEDLSKHYIFLNSLIDGGIKKLAVIGSMHELGYHVGEVNENTPCSPATLYGIAKDTLRKSLTISVRDKDCVFQWLRVFYIYGDDLNNHSVFTKMLEAEGRGEMVFPFTSGKNLCDFIEIDELASQIAACVQYDTRGGIINCCTGRPVSLAEMAQEFIAKNKLSLKIEYGAYPDREYDPPAIWGNSERIENIMRRGKGEATIL